MSFHRSKIIVALLVVVSCAMLAACGDDDDASGDVVLGSGEVPETVPEDFPISEQAAVSSTVANMVTGETEMIVRYPTDIPATVEYYEMNLEARGYTVDRSESVGDAMWEMEFSKGADISGSLELSDAEGVTQVIVRFDGS